MDGQHIRNSGATRSWWRVLWALLAISLAAPAFAQFNNGSFDQGAQGWTWKEGIASSLGKITGCGGIWQPGSANFPNESGRGLVAYLVARTNNTSYPMMLCTQTMQQIAVPQLPGNLVFDYRLGDLHSSSTVAKNYQRVTLSVILQANDGSAAQTLFTDNGVSSRANSSGACVSAPGDCPAWAEGRINLSQFAGKSVSVTFVTWSSERNANQYLGDAKSPAYLDNVRLAGTPPPPPPVVNLSANPTEVTVNAGALGSSLITFSSSNVATLNIWVSANGAPETLFAANIAGQTSTRPFDNIAAGATYVFRAVGTATAGQPAQEFRRVQVRGVAPSSCNGNVGTTPMEGWYLDPARPNTAVQISPRGDSLIFGWLSFDGGGTPVWYFGQPQIDGCGTYSGPITQYHRHPSTGVVTETVVANVRLVFNAFGGASFFYDFAGQSRTVALSYFQFGYGYGSLDLTGFYSDLARPNSGSYVISQGDTHLLANYIYDYSGNATWTFGSQVTINGEFRDAPMYSYSGTGRCPLCSGPVGPLNTTPMGTVTLFPQAGGMMFFEGSLGGNGVAWSYVWSQHIQL